MFLSLFLVVAAIVDGAAALCVLCLSLHRFLVGIEMSVYDPAPLFSLRLSFSNSASPFPFVACFTFLWLDLSLSLSIYLSAVHLLPLLLLLPVRWSVVVGGPIFSGKCFVCFCDCLLRFLLLDDMASDFIGSPVGKPWAISSKLKPKL